MRRLVGAAILVALGATGGAWLPTLIAASHAEGADVRCVTLSSQTVCKGQPIKDLDWNSQRALGGVVGLTCNYERPGSARQGQSRDGIPAIVGGCSTKRYLVSFSDGTIRTNFWVDGGYIAQIDRVDANPMES